MTTHASRLPVPPGRTRTVPPALHEFAYWLHRYRRTWRGTVVLNVANPLLFLTGIGAGLGTLVNHHNSAALGGLSYLAFLTPGLLAASAMQTAYIDSAHPVHQSVQAKGHYWAASATPMSPVDIYYGHLLFNVFKVTLSATAFTAVAAAFGAVDALRAPLVVVATLLVGAAFAAPSAAWAVTAKRQPTVLAVLRFGVMPMFMFSGTFFPLSQLPGWLQPVVQATPLWHGVELCRTAALGTGTAAGTAVHVGYLAVLAVVGLLLGRRTYQRHLHS
ncbi:ABC transporter permease [Streptomyces tendae]|uniref:Transport permease protein n=1 Tax=Streptomyces tendae TaxID=1932 RepID=A0A6B3QXG4_STRTE|nr:MULTISPECIES: ABC transporter permease [Streptomyces]BET51644.1 ABC transporter permease [Kitasatospora aureofaciens]MBQ0962251.1 ABC transporter permease [Streptomyces sp. RK74B]MBQ1002032.1 ABC transporter permease [Streptomyces sp. RK23]MZG19383.1 ABC transporter permease [Streptomyces sp. SID5914]NEV90754.1 ABC transporter permease [Streptomyces tendae]